jgi:AcrR family transcriptional regulator
LVEPGQGQPADLTRQRLLRAAAELFAAKGYTRATTRTLAAAAGVNEVTLFRHFGTKLNLLVAVIEQFSGLSDLAAMLDDTLTGDYRQDMLRLGRYFQEIMAARRTSLRLILCEAEQVPELRPVVGRMPLQLRQMLAGYLRRQMAARRVRPLDPEVMAQAFFGIFFSYNMSEALVPEPLAGGLSAESVVEQFVDLFLNGTLVQTLEP